MRVRKLCLLRDARKGASIMFSRTIGNTFVLSIDKAKTW